MSEDRNPSKITRQDILDALKKPDDHRFKEPVDVIRDKKMKRNDPVVTLTDEALAELKKQGLLKVDGVDGEGTSITFSSHDGKRNISFGFPSRTHLRWGDKGPVQSINNISKELPQKKAELGVELSRDIALAEANVSSIEVPALQISGPVRQI